MKWLARAGLVALMALLAAGGVVNVAALRSLPQLDGQLSLKGLTAEVKVSRDAADVTHIEAASALEGRGCVGLGKSVVAGAELVAGSALYARGGAR